MDMDTCTIWHGLPTHNNHYHYQCQSASIDINIYTSILKQCERNVIVCYTFLLYYFLIVSIQSKRFFFLRFKCVVFVAVWQWKMCSCCHCLDSMNGSISFSLPLSLAHARPLCGWVLVVHLFRQPAPLLNVYILIWRCWCSWFVYTKQTYRALNLLIECSRQHPY